MNRDYYAVIMAGGAGVRFWPLSRSTKPKQFLDVLGVGKSFLQMTFERFANFLPPENILVVTSHLHREIVLEQLPQIDENQVISEPYRRNTAPCIAYTTYKLYKENPKATVVVSPSDHYITNEKLFTETLLNGLDYADKNDSLITLGITPSRAEAEYGYIQANKNVPLSIDGTVAYPVKTFTEKPGPELAEVFVNSGEFLWNSGIFIWSLESIKRELETHADDIASLFASGLDSYNTPNEEDFIRKAYEECKSISIDYAIMEKTEKAIVYPTSFGWADIGTWEALYSNYQKDENGNLVMTKKVMTSDMHNTVVVSEDKEKLVIISNLEGYMVVNTPDILLICPRDDTTYQNLFAQLPLKGFDKFQ